MNTTAAVAQTDADPWKYFWYLVYFAVMGITAIPLFIDLQLPKVLSQRPRRWGSFSASKRA